MSRTIYDLTVEELRERIKKNKERMDKLKDFGAPKNILDEEEKLLQRYQTILATKLN